MMVGFWGFWSFGFLNDSENKYFNHESDLFADI